MEIVILNNLIEKPERRPRSGMSYYMRWVDKQIRKARYKARLKALESIRTKKEI